MKYLMSINEFFQLPKGKYIPETSLKKYEEDCKKDFDTLYTDEDWNKIIQILERDCSEFICEMMDSESILFRGVKGGINEVVKGLGKKKARSDRYALDMKKGVSGEFDNLFTDKFGIPLRRSGTFATKHPLNAIQYTKWSRERYRSFNYLFFPIGDYRYFWNPKIVDLYSDIENEYWYGESDFADRDSEYMEDLWWEIYGEPGQKRDQWSWCKGGGKGEYYYKGKPTGYNTIIPVIRLLRDNPEKWGADTNIFSKEVIDDIFKFIDESGIKKDLTWKPQMTIEEFEKKKEKEILEDSKIEMSKIVSGYQEGGMKDITEQEITFVCKEYYLVDDAFLHKMIEYLNQNVSKLTDNSHSE